MQVVEYPKLPDGRVVVLPSPVLAGVHDGAGQSIVNAPGRRAPAGDVMLRRGWENGGYSFIRQASAVINAILAALSISDAHLAALSQSAGLRQ